MRCRSTIWLCSAGFTRGDLYAPARIEIADRATAARERALLIAIEPQNRQQRRPVGGFGIGSVAVGGHAAKVGLRLQLALGETHARQIELRGGDAAGLLKGFAPRIMARNLVRQRLDFWRISANETYASPETMAEGIA
jgi:hypothetical protein